jgi:hypothetical protein
MLHFTSFLVISVVSAGYYGGCGGGSGSYDPTLKNILQFNRQSPYNYFFCNEDTLSKENPSGYQAMGPAFKVKGTNSNNDPNWVPIYRFYNPHASVHFYTTNSGEILNTVNRNSYNQEGTIGYISTQPLQGTLPLLRFYLPQNNGAHFYCLKGTPQCNDAESNRAKFSPEGTMGYAYPPDGSGSGSGYGSGYGDNSYGGGYYGW